MRANLWNFKAYSGVAKITLLCPRNSGREILFWIAKKNTANINFYWFEGFLAIFTVKYAFYGRILGQKLHKFRKKVIVIGKLDD